MPEIKVSDDQHFPEKQK